MDKCSYAMGMSIAHNMIQSGVKEIAFEDFVEGLRAALQDEKTAISYEEASEVLEAFFSEIQEKMAAEEAAAGQAMKSAGEAYLAENAKKDGWKTLPSGLQYKVLNEGSGRRPGRTDKVKCHYEGTFIDGRKFDSSYDRREPAIFGVNQVIPGWTEALQLMNEGSVWELCIPYQLAYGETGAHGAIPPYATLLFKVELLQVLK